MQLSRYGRKGNDRVRIAGSAERDGAGVRLGCPLRPTLCGLVGHSTVTHRDDGKGLPRWQEAIYAMLERNSTHVSDFLQLPQDKTIELGRQVAI